MPLSSGDTSNQPGQYMEPQFPQEFYPGRYKQSRDSHPPREQPLILWKR